MSKAKLSHDLHGVGIRVPSASSNSPVMRKPWLCSGKTRLLGQIRGSKECFNIVQRLKFVGAVAFNYLESSLEPTIRHLLAEPRDCEAPVVHHPNLVHGYPFILEIEV